MNKKCLIVGAGPAGLLAAHVLVKAGVRVEVFEKRPSAGRKLLIAGSSGLNISYDADEKEFLDHFRARKEELNPCLKRFGKKEWLQYVQDLGITSFLGTSRRYFVEGMSAAPLLKAWTQKLESLGVVFSFNKHLEKIAPGFELSFRDGSQAKGEALLLALGGASYEEEFPSWVKLLSEMNIPIEELKSANCGYELLAPKEFFQEAEGNAIKGVILTTGLGSKTGELMITRYGLEGTPIYTVGQAGAAFLDLKPDLTEEKLRSRLSGTTWQDLIRHAKLSPGAQAITKFLTPRESWKSPESAAKLLKRFSIQLGRPRPIEEAISTAGGVSWNALSPQLEAKKIPGLFFAGEMVDWDAPTGGFLLTATASTAFTAAEAILDFLKKSR